MSDEIEALVDRLCASAAEDGTCSEEARAALVASVSALRAENQRLTREREAEATKARIYKAVLDGPVEASAAEHYRRTGDDPASYAGFCRERRRADQAESALAALRERVEGLAGEIKVGFGQTHNGLISADWTLGRLRALLEDGR